MLFLMPNHLSTEGNNSNNSKKSYHSSPICAIVWRCLGDRVFGRFGTIPAYDGQTDGHRAIAHTTLA